MPQVSSAQSITKQTVRFYSMKKGVSISLRFDYFVLVSLPGVIIHVTHAQVQEIETAVHV